MEAAILERVEQQVAARRRARRQRVARRSRRPPLCPPAPQLADGASAAVVAPAADGASRSAGGASFCSCSSSASIASNALSYGRARVLQCRRQVVQVRQQARDEALRSGRGSAGTPCGRRRPLARKEPGFEGLGGLGVGLGRFGGIREECAPPGDARCETFGCRRAMASLPVWPTAAAAAALRAGGGAHLVREHAGVVLGERGAEDGGRREQLAERRVHVSERGAHGATAGRVRERGGVRLGRRLQLVRRRARRRAGRGALPPRCVGLYRREARGALEVWRHLGERRARCEQREAKAHRRLVRQRVGGGGGGEAAARAGGRRALEQREPVREPLGRAGSRWSVAESSERHLRRKFDRAGTRLAQYWSRMRHWEKVNVAGCASQACLICSREAVCPQPRTHEAPHSSPAPGGLSARVACGLWCAVRRYSSATRLCGASGT